MLLKKYIPKIWISGREFVHENKIKEYENWIENKLKIQIEKNKKENALFCFLMGGADYGVSKNRDECEVNDIIQFNEQGKPSIGICRGAQILNLMWGGEIIQDLNENMKEIHTHYLENVKPSQTPSKFHKISSINYSEDLHPIVNSRHHQGIIPAPDMIIEWYDSVTNLPEAGYNDYSYWIQWHPEREDNPDKTDISLEGLFKFINTWIN